MEKNWFFGTDGEGEEFSVDVAKVRMVTFKPKKDNVLAALNFEDEEADEFYTVNGKAAERAWEEWKNFVRGNQQSAQPRSEP